MSGEGLVDRWIKVPSKFSHSHEEVAWGRSMITQFYSGSKLDGVMGGDEEGSELSEPLKVGPAVFVKLAG
jgi:hypothetical protein